MNCQVRDKNLPRPEIQIFVTNTILKKVYGTFLKSSVNRLSIFLSDHAAIRDRPRSFVTSCLFGLIRVVPQTT